MLLELLQLMSLLHELLLPALLLTSLGTSLGYHEKLIVTNDPFFLSQ